uniref:Protein kinase domain-containing protein n=1 Tax=Romanomermis culicivorax TaxID=13658 RepID=A0A915KFG8_ROMCU
MTKSPVPKSLPRPATTTLRPAATTLRPTTAFEIEKAADVAPTAKNDAGAVLKQSAPTPPSCFTPSSSSGRLKITLHFGELIADQFRLGPLLGKGGFGAVVETTDVRTNYVYAMKVSKCFDF